MSYRFIYGRAGSGKSRTCYHQICESRRADQKKNYMLIVPEQFSFQSEMELLAVGGEETVADVLVCSFKRLSFWVKNKYGIINENQVNKAGKNLILTDILHRSKNKLWLYGDIEDGSSFVNRLSSLLSEFKRYGVAPDHLEKALPTLDENSNTYKKVHDFTILYTEYQKAISGLTDPDDSLYWLAQAIKKDGLFSDYEIWIDRFDGFTPCEYEVILQLMENAYRVNITACTDRVSDERTVTGELFYPVIQTCEKLIRLTNQRNIPREKPVKLIDSKCKFTTPEMIHLEQNLFRPGAKTYGEQTNNISLNIYENIYEEISEVAGKITRLVRDQGYKYGEISVICSDMDSYESYVRSVFTQYRIPCFIDMKKSIDQNSLIIFVKTLLLIHVNRYRSEDIFTLLKTGLTDVSMEEIDLLENYVLKFGIRGSLWNEEIEWDFIKEQGHQNSFYDEDDINLIKNAVVEEIREFFLSMPGKIEAKKFFTRLYDFLSQYGVLNNYKKMTAQFKEEGNLENANRNISAYNALMNLMDTAVDLLEDEKYTVDQYLSFIESGITGYESGSVPPALEQVNVGNVQRSMVHKVKAVFILGANEGKFPGVNLDEGILSDNDRALLQNSRIELAPDTLSRTFETKYLTYKTLCLPSEKLFISCPSMDMRGTALRPAYIFTVMKKLFTGLTVEGRVTGIKKPFYECIGTPESTFRELIRVLAAQKEGEQPESGWCAVKLWYEGNELWTDRIRLIYKAYHTEYQTKPIGIDLAEKLFGRPLTGSVSAFETYTNCPFAFFLQYGLRAKEREKAEITPIGIGSISHTVLEMFFHKIEQNNMDYNDIPDEYITRCVSDEMKRAAASIWGKSVLSSKRNEYILNRYGNTLGLTVKTLLRHITGGEFRPMNQEVIFGGRSGLKPVSITGSYNSAAISGKIDRLDICEKNGVSYIRIIDYKTGPKAFSLEDFYYGLQIQLPVYLNAVMENQAFFKRYYRTDEIVPAGILYYNIDDPVVKAGYTADKEEIEQLVAKQLMLKGLVLDQEAVVKAMDKGFIDKSDIIKVSRNKDGRFSKNSALASSEDFNIMGDYTTYLLKDIVNKIGSGRVDRFPVLKGDYKGCQYCPYKGLCGFDPSLKGCKYNFLAKGLSEDTIYDLMKDKLNKGCENDDKMDG